MRARATRGFLIAALLGGAAMGACSLNTQPIPPGEQADGGQDFGGGASDASSLREDSGTVTGNPTPDADAGDAAPGPNDAGEDASLDADTDAHDE